MPSSSAQDVTERLALLSEPTRLRLLRLLEIEELGVGELATILQLPQSTVSRHLKTLLQNEWIVRRSEGTAGRYRLVGRELSDEARELWTLTKRQLGEPPQIKQDERRLAQVLADRRTDTAEYFGRLGEEWDRVRTELFGRSFTDPALVGLLPSSWIVADLGCGTGNIAAALAPHVAEIHAVDMSREMLAAAKKRLGVSQTQQREHGLPARAKGLPSRARRSVRKPEAHTAADGTPQDSSHGLEGDPSRLGGRLRIPAHAPVSGQARIHFHHANLFELPLKDRSVDAAVISLVLHHLPDPLPAIREASRILRRGGRLLVIDMLEHDRREYQTTMGHHWLGFRPEQMTRWFTDAGLTSAQTWRLPGDPQAKGPDLFAARGTK